MPDLGTATILRADARALPLRDNTVDLVVTSPPYFALRSYQDGGEHYGGQIGAEATPAEFVDALLKVTRECVRVLKPSGSLWVNLGDKYAGGGGQWDKDERPDPQKRRAASGSVGTGGRLYGARHKSLLGIPWRYALRCIDDLGLILRAEIIWDKPNGLPESVTDRVRRSHEQWFHFTLEPRYFSAVDEIRETHKPGQSPSALSFARPGRDKPPGQAVATHREGREAQGIHPLGKLPGSVWNIPTEPLRVPDDLGVDHFAAFPSEWPKRIIQGWSPEGGTVLDPFGGTGTTAMVAKALGRHGISVDMSSDYCRLAGWRTNDRDQLAKVLGVGKAEKQPAEQGDLLALLSGADEVTT